MGCQQLAQKVFSRNCSQLQGGWLRQWLLPASKMAMLRHSMKARRLASNMHIKQLLNVERLSRLKDIVLLTFIHRSSVSRHF